MGDRLVIVGIDSGGNGKGPLDPSFPCGLRLARLLGLSQSRFLQDVDRVNLHANPAPAGTPGSAAGESDDEAAANLSPLLRGRRVIFLGRQVAAAFGASTTWMEWDLYQRQGWVGAVLPHPSGRSIWWDDPRNRRAAEDFMRKACLPCIHVEGVDGSGKTTLTRQLAERSGLELVPTDGPPKTHEECLGRIRRRIRPGVICDRSSGLVSELVYGPILRDGTIAPEPEYWNILRILTRSVLFVYCRPPTGRLKMAFRDGEDPHHVHGVQSRYMDLAQKYDEVMARIFYEGGRVIRYDWTCQAPEEVIQCVG